MLICGKRQSVAHGCLHGLAKILDLVHEALCGMRKRPVAAELHAERNIILHAREHDGFDKPGAFFDALENCRQDADKVALHDKRFQIRCRLAFNGDFRHAQPGIGIQPVEIHSLIGFGTPPPSTGKMIFVSLNGP